MPCRGAAKVAAAQAPLALAPALPGRTASERSRSVAQARGEALSGAKEEMMHMLGATTA